MPKAPVKNGGRPPRTFLTKPEILACRYYFEGLSQKDAAEKTGFSRNYAKELFAKPLIVEEISHLEKVARRAAEKKIATSKAELAERLNYILHLEPEDTNGNMNAQVRAARELAELMGWKTKKTLDLAELVESLTVEEISYLRTLGHGPALEKHLGSEQYQRN